MRRIDPNKIVSPAIDNLVVARSRLAFFQRRLAVARQYRIKDAIAGYEFHVCRSLDLVWDAQQRLERLADNPLR
ncbi:hypothetical protein [Bradyrhizobium cenepequi]